MTIRETAGEAAVWELAEPLLAGPGVERSTRMGLPCLRLSGAFFASSDRRSGELICWSSGRSRESTEYAKPAPVFVVTYEMRRCATRDAACTVSTPPSERKIRSRSEA